MKNEASADNPSVTLGDSSLYTREPSATAGSYNTKAFIVAAV